MIQELTVLAPVLTAPASRARPIQSGRLAFAGVGALGGVRCAMIFPREVQVIDSPVESRACTALWFVNSSRVVTVFRALLET